VTIVGYSTPREVTQALFTQSRSANLQTTELTLPLRRLTRGFNGDPRAFSGQFTYRQSLPCPESNMRHRSRSLANSTGFTARFRQRA
jgi:hypothetical protein